MKNVLVIFAVGITGLIVSGYTVACLWGWFAVPAFGVGTITFAQGCGLYILAGVLTGGNNVNTSLEERLGWVKAASITYIGAPLLALGLGYIVSL